MVKVRIFRRGQKICGFRAAGHSGLAPRGEDIVCAGVSSLTQAALLGVMRHLHRRLDYKQASGELHVELIDDPDDLTEAIFQAMLLGLTEIAGQFPRALCVTETEMR